MEYCKLQIGCMLVILYIILMYYLERGRLRQKHKNKVFEFLLWQSATCVLLDGITAVTVNHLDVVPTWLNQILHMMFLVSIDLVIFLLLLYTLSITSRLPKSRRGNLLLWMPFVINMILVLVFIPSLTYCQGAITNYSMGISAYTCFVMIAIYLLVSIIMVLKHWRYIKHHKRISIMTYLIVLLCVTTVQMVFPQTLISSIATTMFVLGAYMNQENPVMEELAKYHIEMIMGFATLVENKDGSTGGHVKRTTKYVELLANELQHRGIYREELTKDYIDNLALAAPMHDVGKISIPDAILQKPGKLTDEEFARMKQHAANGGKIIRETFGHLREAEYTEMAYQVARFHHEKWNGKGYPDGLSQKEIPLCARIMAIADVFDAVSEKRCYRDAMPLERCFEIIEEGSGQDFDPTLVEVFMDIRDKVEEVHKHIETV